MVVRLMVMATNQLSNGFVAKLMGDNLPIESFSGIADGAFDNGMLIQHIHDTYGKSNPIFSAKGGIIGIGTQVNVTDAIVIKDQKLLRTSTDMPHFFRITGNGGTRILNNNFDNGGVQFNSKHNVRYVDMCWGLPLLM